MASINLQGDTSGSISISAPSVAGSNTLTLPATTQTLATQNALGVRNLIINGDMRIDQRNAGASVTLSGSYQFSVDRWKSEYGGSGSSITLQQSTDAPDNLTNSMKLTIGTGGGSVGSSDYLDINHRIEGNNIAHLGFGQSWAKTFTLSFWVKSSVTGTYGVTFRNNANDRGYRTTYTIDSANTWEQKTLTIAADTTGTWVTNNGVGLNILFFIGAGTTYQNSTLNTWDSSGGYLCANTVSNTILTTTGATFYITGVQLEVGDTATPFEHRPYDVELARCMRYYEKSYNYDVVPGTANVYGHQIGGSSTQGASTTTGYIIGTSVFKVRKRATPTVTLYDFAGNSGKVSYNTVGVTGGDNQTAVAENIGEVAFQATRSTGGTATNSIGWQYTASSEL